VPPSASSRGFRFHSLVVDDLLKRAETLPLKTPSSDIRVPSFFGTLCCVAAKQELTFLLFGTSSWKSTPASLSPSRLPDGSECPPGLFIPLPEDF